MKRLLAVALIALAAVALYASTAPAGQQTVTPKQFATLKKQVATLQKDVKTLKEFAVVTLACVFDKGAIPLTTAPALHVTQPGETQAFYALTTNNTECVRFINETSSLKALRGTLGH